jgi:myo-inositol-1(or 4)-monophosphatase
MTDLKYIQDLARSAGKIAMGHFRNVTPALKEDRSYITQADLDVQAYLREALDAVYPDDGIVAEENGLRKPPRRGDRVWVIDPIDGTAAFSAGLPIWGVSIALVAAGKPIGGVFYIPTVDDLFYTGDDGRVYRNNRPVRLPAYRSFHSETSLLIASRLHRHYTLSRDYPGKLRNLGSTVAHLAYVATGSAEAALVEPVYVWDIAAGMAMLQANGGTVVYIDGTSVDLIPLLDGTRMPRPMLGGRAEAIAAFQELITYHGSDR